MATPQLSPGVLVREVDLTVGRAENVLDNIGAIAGLFEIGPVDDVIEISTEEQLTKHIWFTHRNRCTVSILDDCIVIPFIWWCT